MTREEAIEIIKTERECVERNTQNECDRDCINCDLLRADEEIFSAYDMAIEALQEPERKKGHWEDFDCGNSYRCTSCGEIWTLNDGTPEKNNMNYCPKCGADMRGESE